MSDFKVAARCSTPRTEVLIGDRGYDADCCATHPSPADRRVHSLENQSQGADPSRPVPYVGDKIEIMFGSLEDRRRIHPRYNRRAHTFMSAFALAAIVIFLL